MEAYHEETYTVGSMREVYENTKRLSKRFSFGSRRVGEQFDNTKEKRDSLLRKRPRQQHHMPDINIFRWSILSTELLLNNTPLIQLAANHCLYDKYEGIQITEGQANIHTIVQKEEDYTIVQEPNDSTTPVLRDDPTLP